MNECCTIDNMKVRTPDGTLPNKAVCLNCNICNFSETFIYSKEDQYNTYFAFVEYAVNRQKLGLEIFSEVTR